MMSSFFVKIWISLLRSATSSYNTFYATSWKKLHHKQFPSYSIHVWDIWWPHQIRCTLIACFAEKGFTAQSLLRLIIVYENALNQEQHKNHSPYHISCRFPYASFFVSITDFLESIFPYFTSNMFWSRWCKLLCM